MRNITIDANHAPLISFICCRMEENEGLIKPNASFVVAVEPIIEPTPPTVVIMAGYTAYILVPLPVTPLIFVRKVPVMLTINETNTKVERNSLIVSANFVSLRVLARM